MKSKKVPSKSNKKTRSKSTSTYVSPNENALLKRITIEVGHIVSKDSSLNQAIVGVAKRFDDIEDAEENIRELTEDCENLKKINESNLHKILNEHIGRGKNDKDCINLIDQYVDPIFKAQRDVASKFTKEEKEEYKLTDVLIEKFKINLRKKKQRLKDNLFKMYTGKHSSFLSTSLCDLK